MENPLNFQETQIFNPNLGISCVLGSNSKPWTCEVHKPRGFVSQGLVVQDLRLSFVFFKSGSDRQKYTSQIWVEEGFGILRCGPFFNYN